jgi:hypothetical protein
MADLVFAGMGVLIQQCLGRHNEPRRADAALQGGMFDELLLQRVQFVAIGHAFDGADLAAFDLGAEHQARTDKPAVDGDTTGAAVAGAAAFLGAGETETVAQNVEQRFIGFADEIDLVAVDDG